MFDLFGDYLKVADDGERVNFGRGLERATNWVVKCGMPLNHSKNHTYTRDSRGPTDKAELGTVSFSNTRMHG